MSNLKDNLRLDFPTLQEKIYKHPLIYMDNAATSLTPWPVINVMNEYYIKNSSTVNRGAYYLSLKVSDLYESTREIIASFMCIKDTSSIIFTKGTTESINLVAQSFVKKYIQKNDEILLSIMEHHSNLVPWQNICKENDATLKFVYLDANLELNIEILINAINHKTKFIALTHVSNVLGNINAIEQLIKYAHSKGIYVLIDGAQAVSHFQININELDPDFYVCSGHKLYGPKGIGILYVKQNLLEYLDPYQTGGGMISSVSTSNTTYASSPQKFESGTPNISGVLGLKEAILYIQDIGFQNIVQMENELYRYAIDKLRKIPNLKIIGKSKTSTSVISFILKDIHSHDIASILDRDGIAVRSGYLCAEPLIQYLKLDSVTRISLAFYNTTYEIDKLQNSLLKIKDIFNR